MTAGCLSAALAYASRNVSVLPCRERSREPLSTHGVHSATTDTELIREWWRRYPHANVGIAVKAEWLVVDIDPRNGGWATLEKLEAQHGHMPATIRARSGGGGEHRIYLRPVGLRLKGKLPGGIDLLGPGRYFVAPPSIHPSGKRYQWISEPHTPIAHAPEWLLRLASDEAEVIPLRPRPRATMSIIERARAYLAKCPPAISGSGGHAHTFLIAQKLVRGFELDDDTALSLLSEWNRGCQPPWSKWELRHKVRQAVTRGAQPVGGMKR
jgi:hypothetical protein